MVLSEDNEDRSNNFRKMFDEIQSQKQNRYTPSHLIRRTNTKQFTYQKNFDPLLLESEYDDNPPK